MGSARQKAGCRGGHAVAGNPGGLRSGDARQSAVGNRGRYVDSFHSLLCLYCDIMNE